MRKSVSTLCVFAVCAALFAAACSDAGQSVTAPEISERRAPASSLLDGALGDYDDGSGSTVAQLVSPIQRTIPLAQDVTWSFEAGPSGAVSVNPAVGLKIVIPDGALASREVITVTALAGPPVAYKFEPHGLVFQRSVTLTQSIKGTTADAELLPALCAGYFATDRLELTTDGLASVTELLSVLVNPFNRKATFSITHFSGYIVASGRTEAPAEDDDSDDVMDR
jgi:hypothetical protein